MSGQWRATLGAGSSWAALEQRALAVKDHNGLGIDAGIRDVVVGLWAHGISTDFSCEGHVNATPEADPALAFEPPSIGIAAPAPDPHPLEVDPDDARREPALQAAARAWRVANYVLMRKLADLLERFYADRAAPFHARLQLSMSYAEWGCVDLHSAGGYVTRALGFKEHGPRLSLYQTEMSAFARFLRDTAEFERGA